VTDVEFTEVEELVATFNIPRGMIFDYEWSMFVADQANHRVRRITQDYFVTSYAGSGKKGSVDGTLVDSTFNAPTSVAADFVHSALYVADTGNYRIRKVRLPAGNACRSCESGEACVIM